MTLLPLPIVVSDSSAVVGIGDKEARCREVEGSQRTKTLHVCGGLVLVLKLGGSNTPFSRVSL